MSTTVPPASSGTAGTAARAAVDSERASIAPPRGAGPLDRLRSRLDRVSPRTVRRVLVANLVAQVAIVVTGGAVRLTGSGLGCSTWPQCEPGEFTPVFHQASSFHPFVEFGNRTLTGVLGVIALAALVLVWRSGRARSYRLLGAVPLIGVAVQAVVGGITVLVDLHPAVVGVHFLISMVLVAASTALVVRAREDDGPARAVVGRLPRTLTGALVPLAAVVLVLGVLVTGAGPHSGDDEIAYRLALDPALIARVHAAAVWLFVLLVAALVVALAREHAPRHARRAAGTLAVVTLAQGAVGYVQYFTGLPEVLVAVHMLGAGLLVVAQTHQVLATRERGPVGEPVQPGSPTSVMA